MNCKKQMKKSLELKKISREKTINYMLNGKALIIHSVVNRKVIGKMNEYFPEPQSSGGRVKVELDLSNYATKTDLKNLTVVNMSYFAKKFDLAI